MPQPQTPRSDRPGGSQTVTVIVMIVVALAAAYLFHRLHEQSRSAAAAGAPSLGHDAAANAGKVR